jgi:hypothetical protein
VWFRAAVLPQDLQVRHTLRTRFLSTYLVMFLQRIRPFHLLVRDVRGLVVKHTVLNSHVSFLVSMDILHYTVIALTLVTITKAGVKLP